MTTDLGVCPHCQAADGVERYQGTDVRYCSHCDTKWIGKREAKRCESRHEGRQCERAADHDGLCAAPIGGRRVEWNRGIEQVVEAGHRGPLPPLADERYPPGARRLPLAARLS